MNCSLKEWVKGQNNGDFVFNSVPWHTPCWWIKWDDLLSVNSSRQKKKKTTKKKHWGWAFECLDKCIFKCYHSNYMINLTLFQMYNTSILLNLIDGISCLWSHFCNLNSQGKCFSNEDWMSCWKLPRWWSWSQASIV